MINWRVRIKNPMFWIQSGAAVLATALAYNSMQPSDLTTWEGVGNLAVGIVTNPFLLGSCAISVFNAVTDPTTAGVSDSAKAMSYDQPNADK